MSILGINAGLLVNPPKGREEIAQESQCCRAMYKLTHGNYDPGEQVCRKWVTDDGLNYIAFQIRGNQLF